MKTIKIFDTTLRDGEQSPGANLSIQEKVIIAKQLEKIDVDIIEAGFPIASQGSREAVKQISEQVKNPVICGLARSVQKDIDVAWEALKKAEKARIHVFIATSNIHLEHKLKKSKEDVMKMASDAVKHAKQYCDDIEFSPEDASRTDIDYMCSVIESAIAAGATTINVPDTVGYAMPEEYSSRFKYILEHVPNAKGITLSAHCHDDLGLSVANSLAAIQGGATQIEGTINGIGERAGNTALEEVIMALKTRQAFFNARTNINTKELYQTSHLVSKLTGLSVQRNKAIIGRNAFAHESGIHQHGVIANKATYEIMSADDVGWKGENIVIGKLSGKHAVQSALDDAGLSLTKEQLQQVSLKVKELADKKKETSSEDIIALAIDIMNGLSEGEEMIKLDELSVITGNSITSSSTVGLIIDGEKKISTSTGVGPVDAASKAIQNIIGPQFNLKEYNLKAITGGTDALANVSIKFSDEEKNVFSAESVGEDVISASVQAIINGANKALLFQKKQQHKNNHLEGGGIHKQGEEP